MPRGKNNSDFPSDANMYRKSRSWGPGEESSKIMSGQDESKD